MTANVLDEYRTRRAKLDDIRNQGINPYPERFDKSSSLVKAKSATMGKTVRVAGRIMTIRDMGKIVFCHIQDETGRLQLVFREDEVGKDRLKWFVKYIDPADFVGVRGKMFKTQRGEVSVMVKEFELLSKALRPLPEKWHGLQDQESLYRQRYLDLVSNSETLDRFKFRSDLIKLLREFYWKEGFTEVETPVLTNTPSGALAKPFRTHHNALGTDIYLRIALETYLKECIVGGFEKVFEIGRCFRNEGIDPSHLQDFTMLEHYTAYWNFEDNMKFTEKMLSFVLKKLCKTLKVEIKNRDGELVMVDFKAPWPRASFHELIKRDCGIDINECATADELRKKIAGKKIEIEDGASLGRGNLIDALYKKVSRPKIVHPTFVIHHPIDVSPLARRNDIHKDTVDRFQLVVNGWEIVNAYSELVDPIDQGERFASQAKERAAGDEEAHVKDDEFVRALEHGAPPISGWGMGIDRLVAILTKQDNLRDVVLFPLLRPEQ